MATNAFEIDLCQKRLIVALITFWPYHLYWLNERLDLKKYPEFGYPDS